MNGGRLAGKRALVTGGGRGIGRAIALGFAREGADVAVVYTQGEAEARAAADEIRALGQIGVALRADVAQRADVERVVTEALDSLGPLDVLVNAAGMLTRQPFLELPEADWDRVLAVDLKGPFLLGQVVARQMVERKTAGSIVNVSSLSAERAFPNMVHYQCAKAGLDMLTRGMALELAPYGIRVNGIAPGLTATDINRLQRETQPDVWQARAARMPLGRVGQPDDHVGAAILLASDESSWITGTVIVIDGGQSVS